MRARLVIAAVALAAAPLLPATAEVAPESGAVTMDVGQCGLTTSKFSADYRVVNGRAVNGTWTVDVGLACDQPELQLAASGRLLRNGQLLDGLDAKGDCATSLDVLCTSVAGHDSKYLASGMSGSWQLRVTARITGLDTALMSGEGCTRDAATMTLTCVATSAPVVIP